MPCKNHAWTRWRKTGSGFGSMNGVAIIDFYFQQRRCHRCGEVQRRKFDKLTGKREPI